MKLYSVLEENGPIVEREVDRPLVTGDAVLLDVTHVGVCHSDTHIREGGYHLNGERMLKLADRGILFPITMGHEIVGRVVEIGDSVVGCKIGDIRLIYPWIGCGQCAHCLAGNDTFCATPRALGVGRPGGYAESVYVPDEKYLLDFGEIDPAWAATLACSGVTAYRATSTVLEGTGPDSPIVVIGAGGVGLTAIAMLRARGHNNICAVDMNVTNLEAATALGASVTVHATEPDPSAQIQAAIGGPAAGVIDFVGSTTTATYSVNILGKGGRLALVGLFGGELIAPTVLMTIKMLTVYGSYLGELRDLHAVLALATSGKLPKIPIEAGVLTAANVEASLDRLTHAGVRGRIVLSPAT